MNNKVFVPCPFLFNDVMLYFSKKCPLPEGGREASYVLVCEESIFFLDVHICL